MWPWGHLAVGYLCYVGWTQLNSNRTQHALPVFAVAIGSQFPDLIDKPLAWTIALLPSGRSLAHSLFTAVLVIVVLDRITQRITQPDVTVAFAIGYLTHTLGDLGPQVITGLLAGDWTQLQWTTYLLWPLLPSPPYPNDSSFLAHITALSLDAYVTGQLLLFAVATLVWLHSGAPGARTAYTIMQQRRFDMR